MTTDVQDTLPIYARDTSSEIYSIPFEFTNFSYVKVSIGEDTSWYEYTQVLVYGTDYTIEKSYQGTEKTFLGGSVILLSPESLSFNYICIQRVVPYAQTTPIAPNHLAHQLDAILNSQSYQIQQLADLVYGLFAHMSGEGGGGGGSDISVSCAAGYLPKVAETNKAKFSQSAFYEGADYLEAKKNLRSPSLSLKNSNTTGTTLAIPPTQTYTSPIEFDFDPTLVEVGEDFAVRIKRVDSSKLIMYIGSTDLGPSLFLTYLTPWIQDSAACFHGYSGRVVYSHEKVRFAASRLNNALFRTRAYLSCTKAGLREQLVTKGVIAIAVSKGSFPIVTVDLNETIESFEISVDEAMAYESWRLKVVFIPGSTTQTRIPLPSGVLVPESSEQWIDTHGSLTVSNFFHPIRNYLMYLGSTSENASVHRTVYSLPRRQDSALTYTDSSGRVVQSNPVVSIAASYVRDMALPRARAVNVKSGYVAAYNSGGRVVVTVRDRTTFMIKNDLGINSMAILVDESLYDKAVPIRLVIWQGKSSQALIPLPENAYKSPVNSIGTYGGTSIAKFYACLGKLYFLGVSNSPRKSVQEGQVHITYPYLQDCGLTYVPDNPDLLSPTVSLEIKNSELVSARFKATAAAENVKSATEAVEIVSGVLVLNVSSSFFKSFLVIQNSEISTLVLNVEGSLRHFAFRIKLLLKKGSYTNTSIPIPAGVMSNTESIAVNPTVTVVNFYSTGTGSVLYTGSGGH